MADGFGQAPALPLTEAQEGLWYAQRLDPGNAAFNTGHVIELRGALDVPAFRAAVDGTVAEAEALSLHIDMTGGDMMGGDMAAGTQRLDPARRPWLQVTDVSAAPDPEDAARRAMAADMAAPAAGPLAAQVLFRLAPGRHLWYQRAHHLVLDGYGADLLTRRAAALYAARLAGGDPGQPFPPYAAALNDDAQYRAMPRRAADAAYWREVMADAPDVAPVADGTARAQPAAHRAGAALDEAATAALHRLCAAHGIAWPDMLTALLGAYWLRLAGGSEALLGVAFMNRFGRAAARVPCTAMNVLPLRMRCDEAAPLHAAFGGVLDQLAGIRRHGRYRGEQVRRDLGRVNRPLHGPIINIQPFHAVPAFPGLSATLALLGTGPVEDLTFDIRGDRSAATLHLSVEANPALYSAADTQGHADRAAAFVAAALAAGSLAGVPTATPAEAAFLVGAVNQTAHPVPDTTLARLMEATFAATPDAPAVLFADGTVTFRELDRRSAALAALLARHGVGPGTVVAVALDRSVALVVALVAVLRCGGAYLPLDPAHPPARLARILQSARPALALAEALPGAAQVLPPRDWPEHGDAPPGPSPADAAYVIYTSGSTGEPKGVVVGHRAIVNRLLWMGAQYGITARDRILQKTPATFDVSVWEFFLPLTCGAASVVAPPGAHRDPAAIAGLVRRHGVTALHFVPSMLGAFLAHPAARGLAAARVFCSGEELTPDLRDRFHATMRGELHNLYGPTEAAVDVAFWPAAATDRSRPVPIGRPVWNTRLYVLDDALRPVPPGIAGQLFIAGVQLAQEYLGQPALTARAFLPDPFHPGERMYRTGDLARFRPDGAILFLGRADGQVKLRGFRIELGEVEAAVAAGPGVAQVRVVAQEDGTGGKRLVAYVVPAAGFDVPGFDATALRAGLAARLPDYMVPAAIVPLPALPVGASGKLDRAALPAPGTGQAGTPGTAPATPTERRLAALFTEVLGRPGVGAEDDFFALGGHSLLAVELTLAIGRTFGHDPGLGAVFEHPTVARLARMLDAGAAPRDDGLGPLIRLGGSGGGSSGDPDGGPGGGLPGEGPPLFAVHPAGGIAWCYRGLARALPCPVLGLQAPTIDPAVPPPATLAALARDYADRILGAAPGPVHLAGWSVGGVIAHAVAVDLQARGHVVGSLSLLDAYPADAWRAKPEPDAGAMLRALLLIAGHDPAEYHGPPGDHAAVLGFLRHGGTALGRLPEAALDGVIRVMGANNRLVRGHRHGWFDGTLTHFRAAADHAGTGLVPELWRPYAARLVVVDVPGRHGDMMGAAATGVIAPALRGLMGGALSP